MNNKQTAVDFTQERLKKLLPSLLWTHVVVIFDEAKQMEKEQIVESHHDGYNDGYLKNNASSAKYYYENYGGREDK